MVLLNYIDDEDELLQAQSAVVCTKDIALADPVSRHEISLNHYSTNTLGRVGSVCSLTRVLGEKSIRRRCEAKIMSVRLPTVTDRRTHLQSVRKFTLHIYRAV